MLSDIQHCFKTNRVLYSKHAREEMIIEEFGEINEEEVYQAVMNGEIIENYEHSKPYPSVLILGRTNTGRPIHIVSAYSKNDDLTIIVTVYQPDPTRWINYRRRI
jgi:hypothetical protein